MNPFSTFNRIVLGPLAGLFFLLYGLACVLEPIDGDLTRLGAYWENDYGWNAVQEGFTEPLFDFNAEGRYEHYYDAVVIGDSFSIKNFPYQWQSFLVASTSLTLLTLPVDKVDIDQLIASPVYRNSPPRLVIFESVERAVVSRLSDVYRAESACAPANDPVIPPFDQREIYVPLTPVERNRAVSPLAPNFSESAHMIKGTIKRWYDLNIKMRLGRLPQTVRLPLMRTGLFSSRVQDAILLYRQDFWKTQLTPEIERRALCGLYSLQNRIQSNDITRFVTLVAPDKATAYDTNIRFGELRSHNHAKFIEDTPDAPVAPLLPAIKRAIENGTEDVYMPNDTHWGEAGNRIAADALVRYLRKSGAIR
ncbi:MAG: hypothetical protein KC553_08965 [Nitrospina sp.]|nr:hypothetical protein [Nitrospina sp.]